jgi:hypothetical protein
MIRDDEEIGRDVSHLSSVIAERDSDDHGRA